MFSKIDNIKLSTFISLATMLIVKNIPCMKIVKIFGDEPFFSEMVPIWYKTV